MAEIRKTDLSAVTKFAYLKELVELRVRNGISGLPFTSEGYEYAQNILQTNYGQTNDIINAYVENIQGLRQAKKMKIFILLEKAILACLVNVL